jgi:hypothetical protein
MHPSRPFRGRALLAAANLIRATTRSAAARLVGVGTVVAAAGLLAAPTPASAQGPLGRIELRVEPRFGMLLPGHHLYVSYQSYDPLVWSTGTMGRTGIGGLSAELRLDDGIRVRGTVMRSFRGWLYASQTVLIPPIGFNPPTEAVTWYDVPASLTTGSIEVVLPTWIHPFGTQPYVLAGFTGKRYDFGQPTAADSVGAILPANGVVRALDLGGGVEVTVFGLNLDFQARDTIGRYWGQTQHDIVATAGILWRLF